MLQHVSRFSKHEIRCKSYSNILPLLPTTSAHVRQILHRVLLACREVARIDLCVDFYPRVTGDHVLGDGDALEDLDSCLHDGVVFHVRHGEHAVDLFDSEPVQDVWHEGLEAHLLFNR